MHISLGTRLGPYEILAPLGAGAMGEVYRARDTRLDRTVAIKVLPPHLSENPHLRQRFEREARALSSLSHPHICILHDVGRENGVDFLVMEFLEGETLANRLEKGPLPTEQVLRYGIEIAEALDKAHRQGVIHRDLKPGNIMLIKAGVKLVDFGLAKATTNVVAAALGEMSAAPTTQSQPLTAEGTIVGTLHYMAPEQLEGKEADARSDIFTLGAVLYEMATGRKAFAGKSQASVIAAILSSQPPSLTALQPLAPPALERVVKTCLAKDPDERWQTTHDLILELRWIAEAGPQAGLPAPVVGRRKPRERIAWTAAAVLFLATLALALSLLHLQRAATTLHPVRSNILPPEKSSFFFMGSGSGPVAVAPDGSRLAFVASDTSGKRLLWIRPLDSLVALALPRTEGAAFPFWSPDSRSIGFFAEGKLKRIDASGGPAQTLADAPLGRGGTWNSEGVILFTPDVRVPIYRVSAVGGPVNPATRFDADPSETTHRWPFFLPDGRHFLYLNLHPGGETETDGIYIASLDLKVNKLLVPAFSNPAYAPPGYLLFWHEGTLLAQPFDAKRLELTGDSFPVVEQVQYDALLWRAVFSVSHNGIMAYQGGSTTQPGTQLLWLDRSGKPIGSVGALEFYFSPRLSPDGQRLALQISDRQSRNADIWLYELSRGVRTRFTFDPARDVNPVWSPDGSRIVFASNRRGHFDLYQKVASGAASEELLFESPDDKRPMSWSPDGRFIAYYYRSPNLKTRGEIWVLPLFGEKKPFPFLKTEFEEGDAQFSPDGRWMAYTSDESGRYEVYVAPFPGPGGKWQVSIAGGFYPRWRRDGKELFYLAADSRTVMAVELKATGSSLEAGAARPLFERLMRRSLGTVYDVSPDGQRFLVNTFPTSEQNTSPLTLVINWTADLKR